MLRSLVFLTLCVSLATNVCAQQALIQQVQIQDPTLTTRTITLQTSGALSSSYLINLPGSTLPSVSQLLYASGVASQTISLGWVTPPAVGWSLPGNSGTTAWNGSTGNFLGTTDANALVLATTYTTTPQDMIFYTGNSERMRILGNGNVGIGTTAPASIFHVASNNADNTNDCILDAFTGAGVTYGAEYVCRRARGTITSPSNIATGDVLGGQKYFGYYSSDWRFAGEWRFTTNGTPSNSGIPTDAALYTSDGTASQPRLYFTADGKSGVNTATPTTVMDINGDLALRQGSALSWGTNTSVKNVSVGTYSFIRASSSNDIDLTGFSGGNDGKLIILYYTSSHTLEVVNKATSDAANQIVTNTGADVSIVGPCAVTFIYDGNGSRWIMISHNP